MCRYLVMSDDLAPVILPLTHTLLRHWRQLLLLPQSVSERVKWSNFCLFGLEFNYFCCPSARFFLLAIADIRIHFTENVVNLFTRARPLNRVWGRIPEREAIYENLHHVRLSEIWLLPYDTKVCICNLFWPFRLFVTLVFSVVIFRKLVF